MEDGIVATGVYLRYCNDIMQFLTWIQQKPKQSLLVHMCYKKVRKQ
jgi:hypothetical protein